MRFRHLSSAALALAALVGCVPESPDGPGSPDPSGSAAPGGGAKLTEADAVEATNHGIGLVGQYLFDEAAARFETALRYAPDLVDVNVNLAICYFNRQGSGDIDRAAATLDAALRVDPDHLRGRYYRAIVHMHKGTQEDNQRAIALLEGVAKERPHDGAVWYLLGLCKDREGLSAVDEFRKALAEKPHLVSAHYKLYRIFLKERNRARRAGDEEAEEAAATEAGRYEKNFKELRDSAVAETITVPQYDQMGELALVQPIAARESPPASGGEWSLGDATALGPTGRAYLWPVGSARTGVALGGLAVGDVNADGRADILAIAGEGSGESSLALLLGAPDGAARDATAGSGLETVRGAVSCALGDVDNDGSVDVFVACAGPDHLLLGKGDGTFRDVTEAAGVAGGSAVSRAAVLLDADHDADLDIFVAVRAAGDGEGAASSHLWNNNADGTFSDLSGSATLGTSADRTVGMLPGDVDGDRDTDLVLLREGGPARIFLNDLQGSYHEAQELPDAAWGDRGGVLQELTGDGQLDLLLLGGDPPRLRLLAGDGRGGFAAASGLDATAGPLATHGEPRGLRIADVDLDGDFDVIVASRGVHLLVSDGRGRFSLVANVLEASGDEAMCQGLEILDWNGDGVADLLRVGGEPAARAIEWLAGDLDPPGRWIRLALTGKRQLDPRMRSPASGYGTRVRLQAGSRGQDLVYTGLLGGSDQSSWPWTLGLAGHSKADFISLSWTDGVAQAELALNAGEQHVVPEHERKISSCPVLFAYDGERFRFVTDFAGVGGLGYFAGPGEYADPQVLEHVKIEPDELRARDGGYELRITEPMEETAYIDRLELLAIDHAPETRVYPDERLAISGPGPTHRLLVVDDPIRPVRATGPDDQDCTPRVSATDRLYAYDPPLDPRFFGFCRPHSLRLDFGDRLASIGDDEPLWLFIRGYIEYPYSQTVYAAGQADVAWEPIRIERRSENGEWRTIVPDGGAPGGMGRMITVDLSGQLGGQRCEIRLTTNLEIRYDEVFLAVDRGLDRVQVRSLELESAVLRKVGFALEFSPDGRHPLIYDYHRSQPSAPFHVLAGEYTRYGPVEELLGEFDDRYVLVGPGDEIAVRYGAGSIGEVPPGRARSFILVSHAYCKDMDLYTATPDTVGPLPFRGMSRYPPPAGESYPDDASHREFRARYNTRRVE